MLMMEIFGVAKKCQHVFLKMCDRESMLGR
jgi:hypothetical protein